jgi:Lsr2
MAQRTITQLLDDIDGSTAAESVQFGLDGKSYSIDLSDENANRLREGLSRYVSNAQLITSNNSKPKAAKKPARNSEDVQKIREWAKANGYEVNPRGRISQEINQKYLAYQQASQAAVPTQPAFYG